MENEFSRFLYKKKNLPACCGCSEQVEKYNFGSATYISNQPNNVLKGLESPTNGELILTATGARLNGAKDSRAKDSRAKDSRAKDSRAKEGYTDSDNLQKDYAQFDYSPSRPDSDLPDFVNRRAFEGVL